MGAVIIATLREYQQFIKEGDSYGVKVRVRVNNCNHGQEDWGHTGHQQPVSTKGSPHHFPDALPCHCRMSTCRSCLRRNGGAAETEGTQPRRTTSKEEEALYRGRNGGHPPILYNQYRRRQVPNAGCVRKVCRGKAVCTQS